MKMANDFAAFLLFTLFNYARSNIQLNILNYFHTCVHNKCYCTQKNMNMKNAKQESNYKSR